jgi:ABC-type lipoprotein release transport system permease subunit
MKINFKFLLKYSFRNLLRTPQRSFIILAGLIVSIIFIIWGFNFNDSALIEIQNEITSHYTGNFQVGHPKFNLFGNKIETYHFLTQEHPLYLNPNLTKRVVSPVFVSGPKKTVGSLLIGVDVLQESKITNFHKAITAGSFFQDNLIQNPIILGERLANKLNLKLGEEVVVISQGVDGSIANDLFILSGLLNFGGGDLEEKLIFTTIDKAREFLSMPPNSFHLFVGTDLKTLEDVPKNNSIIYWHKLLPDVHLSITFMDKLNWILTSIMVFVVSLGISNTLFVSFNEREKEYQSLSIIGANSRWIALSLFFEVMILLIIALILGNGLGILVTKYFHKNPVDIRAFTEGRDIMLGGMKINPIIRFYHYKINNFIASVMISTFVLLAMSFPIIKVLKRSQRAS